MIYLEVDEPGDSDRFKFHTIGEALTFITRNELESYHISDKPIHYPERMYIEWPYQPNMLEKEPTDLTQFMKNWVHHGTEK